MADDTFLAVLGDSLEPSNFYLTAGPGYVNDKNFSSGQAIAKAAKGWFLGPAVEEFYGNISLTLTPDAECGADRVYLGTVQLSLTPAIELTGPRYRGFVLFRFISAATYGQNENPAEEFLAATDSYIQITSESEFTSVIPTITELVATYGYMVVTAESAFDIVTPVLPTTTSLAADGSLTLSAQSDINSIAVAAPGVTALAASGSLALSSTCSLGYAGEALYQTDFITIGSLRLSSIISLAVSTPPITVLAAAGGFQFNASCSLDSPAATVYNFAGAISFLLGGEPVAAVIQPSVTAFIAIGGFVLSSPGETTVFEAWVLNGQSFEPSIFSAFRFNSFAQQGTQAFAAGENGIYLLGGDNDNGEIFHTGARIGPINFGIDREKRLRGIRLGNCGPETKVKVLADDSDGGEGIFTPDKDENRVVVSRDIQGREFMIDIQDFQELGHFEASVLKLARR